MLRRKKGNSHFKGRGEIRWYLVYFTTMGENKCKLNIQLKSISAYTSCNENCLCLIFFPLICFLVKIAKRGAKYQAQTCSVTCGR